MRGIPFSSEELRLASRQPRDIYHRELMQWAANRIDELETKLSDVDRDAPLGTAPAPDADAGAGSATSALSQSLDKPC